MDNLEGKKVIISGIVIEHLKLNTKEWVEIQLQDKTKIIVSTKLIEVVNDNSDK